MGTVLNREEKQKLHIHNNKMFVKAALFTLLVCSSQAGWQQHLARQASKPAGNLVEELAANGASTLIDFAVKAGLADTLTGEGPFAKISEATLNGLLADKEALTKVLLRHVAPGAVFAKGVNWGNIATAGGENVCTQVFKTGAVKVSAHSGNSKSSAMVVEADITATNGVIHAIDTVI